MKMREVKTDLYYEGAIRNYTIEQRVSMIQLEVGIQFGFRAFPDRSAHPRGNK